MRHALVSYPPTGFGSRKLYETNALLKYAGGPIILMRVAFEKNGQKDLIRRRLHIEKGTQNYARS
jgi:hypothetical protein